MTKNEPARWLLLIHQLPGEPAYLRVKVGRRLARVGAVALKNSVYVLPAMDACREDFSWIRREIVDEGGDASVFEAKAIEGLTDADLERGFREARAKEYEELARELAARTAALKPDRPQERPANLSALARFEEQLSVVERIDFFPSGLASGLRQKLQEARAQIEQRAASLTASTSERLQLVDYQGRTWVTRSGVKIDRVACAWLITRFVDKTPKFKFVDPARYTHRGQELRFDMAEAEFTHEGDLCSFEVLCRRFGLSAPGLLRIAEIVHDLDIKDARHQHPETEGVRAFIEGLVAQHARDEARIDAASTLFDALLQTSRAAPKEKPAVRGGRNGRTQGRAP